MHIDPTFHCQSTRMLYLPGRLLLCFPSCYILPFLSSSINSRKVLRSISKVDVEVHPRLVRLTHGVDKWNKRYRGVCRVDCIHGLGARCIVVGGWGRSNWDTFFLLLRFLVFTQPVRGYRAHANIYCIPSHESFCDGDPGLCSVTTSIQVVEWTSIAYHYWEIP
jgi:hypothetical protein